MIKIKNLDLNNIKTYEIMQNIHIYYNGYAAPNSIKSLYLIINEANKYIEESNGNKHKLFT